MDLKPYQPHRKEFLINTGWGTAKDAVSKEEAKNRGLLLFKGRWVTKEENALLKDEYHAYHSIRIIAKLLTYLSVFFLIIMVFSFVSAVSDGGGIGGAAASFIAGGVILPAGIIGGIGLLKYRRWARNLVACVFAAFLIIPFLADSDKGAPMLFFVGLVGLYYFWRKTARRIFNEG